jgi:hypothetical protein
LKAQAAIDFLSSYGIAIIIISIAIVVVYRLSVSDQYIFSSSCTAFPGFACSFYSIDTNGILHISLSQATGGPIHINGIACSTTINSTKNAPAYGNTYVSNSVTYYPSGNYIGSGITLNSGSTELLTSYCYNVKGVASVPQLGTSFTGYVWMNYTIPSTSIDVTQVVASVTMPYT